MLNTSILIGKIDKIYYGENGEDYFDLAVERDFREQDGTFKVDLIRCTLWRGITEEIRKYYHPGQMLLISGRLENRDGQTILVGEKANFTKDFSR